MDDQIQSVRRFNRFYTRLLGLLGDRLLDSPVSLTEARIILEIHYRPRVKAGDLIQDLGIDRGYLSRIIRRLERAGYICRRAHPRDGRVRILSLTDQGQALLRELEGRSSDQIRDLLKDLSPEERESLIKGMDLIQRLLDPGKRE
jgi:DNA-binding MarR family transcriptional regulator